MSYRNRSSRHAPRRRPAACALFALLLGVLALGLAPVAAAASASAPPATPVAISAAVPVPAPPVTPPVAPAVAVANLDWHTQVAAALAARGTVVQFGKDATIGADQQADAVVSLGGNVTVDGTVQVAVAVGGDIIVNGTVEKTCVAVGGDVTLRPTAVVGSGLTDKSDAAVVMVGGRLVRDPGAQLNGSTTSVQGEWFTNAAKWGVWDPVMHPFSIGSILGWFIQTIVLCVLAIIAVAVAPRQVRAVGQILRRRALGSLGWGALTGIIIIPVSIVLLAITIIGLLIVVPSVLIALPLTALFSFLCLCVFVGILVLGGSERHGGNLILAALIGVAIVNVVRLIPFAGGIVVALATLMAFGAVVLAIADWQRRRRETRRLTRAAVAAGPQPPAPGASPAGGSPYGVPLLPPPPPPPPAAPIAPTAPYGALDMSIAAAALDTPAAPDPALAPPEAAATAPAAAPEPTRADATAAALMTAKLPVPGGGTTTGPSASAPAPAALTEVEAEPLEAPPAPPAEPAEAPPDEAAGPRPQDQA